MPFLYSWSCSFFLGGWPLYSGKLHTFDNALNFDCIFLSYSHSRVLHSGDSPLTSYFALVVEVTGPIFAFIAGDTIFNLTQLGFLRLLYFCGHNLALLLGTHKTILISRFVSSVHLHTGGDLRLPLGTFFFFFFFFFFCTGFSLQYCLLLSLAVSGAYTLLPSHFTRPGPKSGDVSAFKLDVFVVVVFPFIFYGFFHATSDDDTLERGFLLGHARRRSGILTVHRIHGYFHET